MVEKAVQPHEYRNVLLCSVLYHINLNIWVLDRQYIQIPSPWALRDWNGHFSFISNIDQAINREKII